MKYLVPPLQLLQGSYRRYDEKFSNKSDCETVVICAIFESVEVFCSTEGQISHWFADGRATLTRQCGSINFFCRNYGQAPRRIFTRRSMRWWRQLISEVRVNIGRMSPAVMDSGGGQWSQGPLVSNTGLVAIVNKRRVLIANLRNGHRSRVHRAIQGRYYKMT